MTNDPIKTSLQQICSDSNLKVLNFVADSMIKNWNSSSSVGVNEWETVKATITKEQRAKALQLFLVELEKLAHE